MLKLREFQRQPKLRASVNRIIDHMRRKGASEMTLARWHMIDFGKLQGSQLLR